MGGDLMDAPRCKAIAKSTGIRCGRRPIPGGTVCVMHGGAAPAVRAAAKRRQDEVQAAALLEVIWDPDAAAVTDPVEALQRLAGKLEHATNVLGGMLASGNLDQPTALAWTRVMAESRRALEGMARLDLGARQIEIEQERAQLVTAAVLAGLEVLNRSLPGGLLPQDRSAFLGAFLTGIGRGPEVLEAREG